MRSLRGVLMGLVVLGAVLFFSGVSFAHENKEVKVKTLQDASAALAQSNPELAKGLSDFANEEAKETKNMTEGAKKSEGKESSEWKAKHEARVKLLKDSADALAQSHPDLSKALKEMSERKHKDKMQQMKAEKNEKEEVGEKTESKSEVGEKK
jgi:hypothetical protein